MKIKYLGTGAYEGVPALYCQCRVCRASIKSGGRSLRSRSQAIIDDKLLIDFGPDTVSHFLRYRIDWSKIGDCLITHSHSDHLYDGDIPILGTPFSHKHRKLHFYVGQSGYEILQKKLQKENLSEEFSLHQVKAGERFITKESKYDVLALHANHSVDTSPLFYAISKNGKRLLYAHDTGLFYEDVYAQLKDFGQFDLISLDCTGCIGNDWEWRDGHMSLKTNLELLKRLLMENIIGEKTIVVINHFSHNGGQTYDEMLYESAKNGVIVAYDGMEIVF